MVIISMKGLKRGYIFLVLLFLYLPIIVMTVLSFDGAGPGKDAPFWQNYLDLFTGDKSETIMNALWVTVSMALIACVISTIIGTFAAIGIDACSRKVSNLIINITYIPMVNPDIVTGIAMMLLFVYSRLQLGYFTMLLAHIAFCTPYVIFAVLPKLQQMSNHIYEAALDLGATPMQTILRVIIPQIRSGIITGALLAFTLSIDDFAISFFTTGNGVDNLSTYIYSIARTRGVDPVLNALSVLMVISIFGLMLIINRRADLSDLY